MKITRILVAVVLTLLLLQGMAVVAEGPAGTWASGIQIQNQSDQQANITVKFYWADNDPVNGGTLAYTHTDTIDAKKSVTYYVPNLTGLPDGFVGSAVVEADQPIAAILNTNKVVGTTEPNRLGSANGVLTPSTTVYAPYLRRNYYSRFNSYIAVQNTSNTAADVTITYKAYADGSTAATETASVSAYSSRIFYQNETAGLGDGFRGGAVVESTVPLAVVVNDADSGASEITSSFESYNGLSEGSTTLYLPKLSCNYYTHYQSSFTVQNVGDTAATITANYTFKSSTDGQTYTFSKTSGLIQPGAVWGPYLAAEAQSGITQGFMGTGSAIVTSSQPLVGVVTETNLNLGTTYIFEALPTGGTSILFPKFDRNYYGYNGGIQFQNVSGSDATVYATFSGGGLTSDVTTAPVTLAPGASSYWYSESVPGLIDNFYGSVVVTSDQDIVAVYTSLNNKGGRVGDHTNSYVGIIAE